jgi:valyl-tRNA synthetase
MKEELAKRYEPARPSSSAYAILGSAAISRPDATARPKFSIVIPPPNVTGRLHIGHALVNTLIDIVDALEAHERLQHALAARHRPRRHRHADGRRPRSCRSRASPASSSAATSSSRRSGSGRSSTAREIKDQLSRSAPRPTGPRERFTLDEGLSRAVREVFVKLYDDDLIYRDLAMVNWCPHCRTAISDVEVEHRERTNAKLYRIDYTVANADGGSARSPWPRHVPKQCSATPRWRSIRTTIATRTSSEAKCSCRSPTGASP